ncbi:hypothetical protein V8C43DRAFT_298726 [Trichoderma afarasin]
MEQGLGVMSSTGCRHRYSFAFPFYQVAANRTKTGGQIGPSRSVRLDSFSLGVALGAVLSSSERDVDCYLDMRKFLGEDSIGVRVLTRSVPHTPCGLGRSCGKLRLCGFIALLLGPFRRIAKTHGSNRVIQWSKFSDPDSRSWCGCAEGIDSFSHMLDCIVQTDDQHIDSSFGCLLGHMASLCCALSSSPRCGHARPLSHSMRNKVPIYLC